MKHPIFILAIALVATAALSERIASPTLPPSAFADTEASTNIAITAWDVSRSSFVLLTLDACWFLDAPGLTNRVEMLPATADARKTVTLRLGIRPNDSIREVSLLDGGVPILPSPLGMDLPSAASWNMLRVTIRGCAPPQECLEVRNSPDGTQLIMR